MMIPSYTSPWVNDYGEINILFVSGDIVDGIVRRIPSIDTISKEEFDYYENLNEYDS